MKVVVDASVTIARVHADEITPAIVQLFDQVRREGAIAPPLWRAEVANILQVDVRKKRYDTTERDRILQDVFALPVFIDSRSDINLWPKSVDLAHLHKLSVYDAIYLECAVRNRLPLATLDIQLRAAAAAEGVALLGL